MPRAAGAGRRPWRAAVLVLALFLGGLGAAGSHGQAAGDPVSEGERLFSADMTAADGLGPLFNHTSCAGCHSAPTVGGMGPDGLGVAIRIGRLEGGTFDPLEGAGGPVARSQGLAGAGGSCGLLPGVPAGATVTSVRNAPALFGLGLVDAISDEVILAGAVPRGDGVHGRANLVPDSGGRSRVGRFGWKADVASLERFVAEAFRNEHGITNPLFPLDVLPPAPLGCPEREGHVEDDGSRVGAVTSFVASLPAPQAKLGADGLLVSRGAALFNSTGCASCHTPALSGPQGEVRLYSDLLLHDMGPALDDGVVQHGASGPDWRTTPLWGLGDRMRFLHDGRARTIRAAIQAHGGEATAAAARFRELTEPERQALLAFLAAL